MSAAIDDEDLSISLPANPRRGSNRPSDQSRHALPTPPTVPREGAASAAASRAGQRLGQYTVVKTLGEGSFGKVKLAVHQISGQQVALKIINRKKLVTRDMAGRIEREIQYLQLLRHPHIIKLYTVITTSSEIIMVLEYAERELFDYIVQNGKFAEDKARKFFQQIICAVEYCHRHKIVHRDLKPENLLLDTNNNVKIADFGLSNIMTDGNFLKTSCGSPNYAAPEVISGKLYAGPEVDVWSCGVILYVLLAGKLPFDDEYIPALFKKIAHGQYNPLTYISQGADRLIRKMLQVNPVHRITIQEIRQDPWFIKDLAPYLEPPPEEFFDTGVDPNKAIDPSNLGPSKPAAVVQKLHDTVVGKLGKTMGYAENDVQEALAKDEPSAIKDAYLIVRENQIMKENPLLSNEAHLQPFLAQSPPTMNSHMAASPLAEIATAGTRVIPPASADRQRHGSSSSAQQGSMERSPATTIGVLPSSLPDYHKAYMKGVPASNLATYDHTPPNLNELTSDEKEATKRRLKGSGRSSTSLDKTSKPDSMTPIPPKKSRPTKWQFGIRSRNAPAEAMLAIYKALAAMGAEWEAPRIRRPGGSRSRSPQSSRSSRSSSRSSSPGRRRHSRSPRTRSPSPSLSTSSSDSLGEDGGARRGDSPTARGRPDHRRRHYDKSNDWGYAVPADPWVINARFRKEGMYPPGVLHPSSSQSSRVDLVGDGTTPRRRNTNPPHAALPHHPYPSASSSTADLGDAAFAGPASGRASVAGSASELADPQHQQQHHSSGVVRMHSSASSTAGSRRGGAGSTAGAHPEADESVFVYVTIQLYSIEREFFLVDFKCAGYERLVATVVKEVREAAGGEGAGEPDDGAGSDGEHVWMRQGRRAGAGAQRPGEDTAAAGEWNDRPEVPPCDSPSHSPNRPRRHDIHSHPGDGGEAGAGWRPLRPAESPSGRPVREREEEVGGGRATAEKRAASPFPFLDVASRLIIQLAEGE